MFDEQTEQASLSIAEKDRRLKATNLNYLAKQGWEARVKTVNFELGAPDVGGDLHQPALLWQGVQIVHLLVADVSKVMRLVPTSSQPSPSPESRTVERGRFVLISVVGV